MLRNIVSLGYQLSKGCHDISNIDIHMTGHNVQMLRLSLGMVFIQELRHERD